MLFLYQKIEFFFNHLVIKDIIFRRDNGNSSSFSHFEISQPMAEQISPETSATLLQPSLNPGTSYSLVNGFIFRPDWMF
jgi:hypothetical protein